MGLDTSMRPLNSEEDVSYWRKCWGIDSWLGSKAIKVIEPNYEYEFNTKILKPIIPLMEKYIKNIIKKARKLGYRVKNIEELWTLTINLYEENSNDYYELEKIIKSFSYDGLDFEIFEDSIWNPISLFLQTHQQFKNAVKYPTLILTSSF